MWRCRHVAAATPGSRASPRVRNSADSAARSPLIVSKSAEYTSNVTARMGEGVRARPEGWDSDCGVNAGFICKVSYSRGEFRHPFGQNARVSLQSLTPSWSEECLDAT